MTTSIPALEIRKTVLEPYSIGHIPVHKKITAREVVTKPDYATLRQTIHAALTHPRIAKYYINNRGEGNWCNTVVFYNTDASRNERNEWFEGPVEISDRVTRPTKFSRSGRLYLPDTGWVKAVKDGDRVITYDMFENGGFARETTDDKQVAEESYKENGLDPKLVSKQWRRSPGKHGLVPVYRYSNSDVGPLSVDADWGFDDFDYRNPNFGALPVSG
ncbi:MAG: hypothetical protein ABIA21_02490 [Candidatus Aenigmatarchaeota archaeon]